MGALIILIIWLVGIVGYIMNICDVVGFRHVPSPEWTVGMVFHVIGIFVPPLGALMGLFF